MRWRCAGEELVEQARIASAVGKAEGTSAAEGEARDTGRGVEAGGSALSDLAGGLVR